MVSLRLTSNSQLLHVILGNQTVGLNITKFNSPELPTGIYHCEMMDRENDTYYLYVGIYLEMKVYDIVLKYLAI